MSARRTRGISATALPICALLASCADAGDGVSEVSLDEYRDIARCWFRDGEELKAFLVIAEGHGVSVPWLVSSRCIAKDDLPSFGAGTLYTLGPPAFTDPSGLLRRHVAPNMVEGNAQTHLPGPGSGSPVYYIVARLRPLAGHQHLYELTSVGRATPTGVTFGQFLEMGPAQRTELLAQVR